MALFAASRIALELLVDVRKTSTGHSIPTAFEADGMQARIPLMKS